MLIDETFLPVAVELIQNVFPTPIVYHRSDGKAYDPATGEVVETITDYSISAGVLSSGRMEAGGTAETYELVVWLATESIGEEFPTTSDHLLYRGMKWKVTSINPEFSGDVLYACQVTARNQ